MDGFLANLWSVLLELSPWLLLGAVAAGLLHGLVPPGLIRTQLRGPLGVLKAVAVGVPLPLCSCGVIPTGLGLHRDGASQGATVGFLTATPQTGVDSVLVSASFLGWPFALSKVVAALVTGTIGGLLADAVDEDPAPAPSPSAATCAVPRPGLRGMVDHAVDLVRSIYGWLTVGVLVSAALTTFLPADAFAGMATGGGLVLGFLGVLLVSIPLYVCATASVPIAAALVQAGMPTGAAMVFLMAGPATNIATIGALHRALGPRATAVYLLNLIAGSLSFGLLYEALFGQLVIGAHAHGHEHQTWWATAAAVALVGMVGTFAAQDLAGAIARRRGKQMNEQELVIAVEGMTCGGCASRLERVLRGAEGVASAEVQLEAKKAVVKGPIRPEAVRALISGAGFDPVDLHG
jgi:uncharacterized membrane protein YraQ (UPF0718 family)/copper chaperone CopZ